MVCHLCLLLLGASLTLAVHFCALDLWLLQQQALGGGGGDGERSRIPASRLVFSLHPLLISQALGINRICHSCCWRYSRVKEAKPEKAPPFYIAVLQSALRLGSAEPGWGSPTVDWGGGGGLVIGMKLCCSSF